MTTNKLVWNGAQVTQKTREAGEKGLRDAAEFILDQSNQRAPIDEGTLINSGSVNVTELTASISYDTPYAVRQHEDTTLRHTNGRDAKFLETALKEHGARAQQYIANALQDALR